MLKLEYSLRFLCPAFLGNADQQGQWRTPPIKALLRQWWRVAYSADHGHRVDVDAMRAAERALFGVAADKDGESRRSQIRVRLESWSRGTLTAWRPLDEVHHPEVDRAQGQVGSDLYLGYGPLSFAQGRPTLKSGAAIQADESSVLRLGLPSTLPNEESARVSLALSLMNRYGTLGGRSRNGWGSFDLRPLNGSPAMVFPIGHLRAWKEALNLDWPHAIGRDDRPLVWQSPPMQDWRAAMQYLAKLKIDLRTSLPFPTNERAPHAAPLERHWLAYPVTNHATSAWSGDARLPNSLRFRLRCDFDDKSMLRALVIHVPCKPPGAFKPKDQTLVTVWSKIHKFLDQRDDLSRIPA